MLTVGVGGSMRWLALVTVGCGLSEDAYREQLGRASCERNNACAAEAGADTQDCDALSAPPASTIITCDYDADAAASCLDAVPTAPCQGAFFTSPPVCAQVLTNCTQR